MARPADWHTTPTMEALRLLLQAGVRIRRVVSRRTGLSELELAALEHVDRGTAGPAALARQLEVSSAAATGIVDRLSRRGHLERAPDASDRRRTRLLLTDSANAEVQQHLGPMFAGLAQLDASFSEEERAIVERYLRGVLDCLDEVIAEP